MLQQRRKNGISPVVSRDDGLKCKITVYYCIKLDDCLAMNCKVCRVKSFPKNRNPSFSFVLLIHSTLLLIELAKAASACRCSGGQTTLDLRMVFAPQRSIGTSLGGGSTRHAFEGVVDRLALLQKFLNAFKVLAGGGQFRNRCDRLGEAFTVGLLVCK